MNYFINGEVYLKRGPSIFDAKKELSDVYDEIDDLNFETSKENVDFSKLGILREYEDLRDSFEGLDGEADYSGTREFWQVFATEDNKVKVVCADRFWPEEYKYNSILDLEKDFVKLSDFLEKSVFVGRQFTRTKPIEAFSGRPDKSYIYDSSDPFEIKYIVLYATQDLFLAMRLEKHSDDEYFLINSRYTLDGNYEFLGEVHEEYRDKAKVYNYILTQINKDKGKHL